MIEVRDAVTNDAAAACDVLRRSISELCIPDHKNNPEILARWLRNKTPENIASWINDPENSVLIAIGNAGTIGVGMITKSAEIELIYVSPEARFQGVSKALLSALEAQAIKQGNMRCTLNSSETAHRFYRSAGYSDEGEAKKIFGVNSYPMSKSLTMPVRQN